VGYTPESSINNYKWLGEKGEFWRRNLRSYRPEEENSQKDTLDA